MRGTACRDRRAIEKEVASWHSLVLPQQGDAQVHEETQVAGLPRQECLRRVSAAEHAAQRTAPPPGHPASYALLAEPMPGPGESPVHRQVPVPQLPGSTQQLVRLEST